MNRRMVGYLLGQLMLVELLVLIPPMFISMYCGEWHAVRAFLYTILLVAAGGLALLRLKPQNKAIYSAEGFVVTALGWVLLSFFGGLPFFFSGAITNPFDCFFEIVSGFTTTGASILSDVEVLPKGILFWRSFTHWLGGMGVLVFLLAVAPGHKSGEGHDLYLMRAESPGPAVDKFTSKIRQSAKILYAIYIGMSVLETVLLLAGGMPLFDSLCNMFGTAGTGGFSIKNASMAAYPSFYLQGVVTVFMALFGVNFTIFYLLLIREFSQALHDEELRCYLGIMLGSIALITINVLPHYKTWFEALHHAAFQVSSVMTTTGYATTDFNAWPQLSKTILVLLMILGASAGSTGGGIKSARIVILFKSVRKEIRRMLHPRAVQTVQMNGKPLEDRIIKGVNVFMAVYFCVMGVSFLLVSLDDFDMITNLTAVLSCLNNIGPGLELVGPTGNFGHFSNFSKLVLTADMLLGRLEIFPMLLLFSPTAWKCRRDIRCRKRA